MNANKTIPSKLSAASARSCHVASLISEALEGASYATKWQFTRGRASLELSLASEVSRSIATIGAAFIPAREAE